MCTDDNSMSIFILHIDYSRIAHETSTTNYELSQDLHDKQIEILERKYGGNLRCRHAAKIIQRAYRQYRLRENFRHLCATIKTNQRLSCTFIENTNQKPSIKPLKPCLRLPKNVDHHLDLPSINFEHFIESNHPPTRKRVCIITDQPAKILSETVDNLSDFIDGQMNDVNFYKDLTSSPMECRKPIPPGKILDKMR